MSARPPDREAARTGAWARVGWFIAFWGAGVLAITATGLTIRFALGM